MKIKKTTRFKILRTAIQLIFLILLPGLYANAFLGIRLVCQSILSQDFSFSTTFPQLISAIAILPLTLLLGRFFCGWMCAFGTLGDLLYLFSNKVLKISYRVDEKTDHLLKYVKYAVLLFILIAAWSLQAIDLSYYSPWDAFGNLLSFTRLPDFSYVITNFTIGFLLLLFIIAGSLFIERFFCRYLCPLGAVFAIISHLRFIKIRKPGKDCGSCKACTKSCSMGIPLYQVNQVSSGECIQCMNCVSICPRSNVSAAVAHSAVSPALAGALAVTAMTGVYYIGTFATDNMASAATTAQSTNTSESTGLYKDGTYSGSGSGFRGETTTVSVTVSGGVITDIEAVSYGDDREFFDRAFSSIVSQIISTQSTEVDAVSGATFSSNGIMEAVANALNSTTQSSDSTSDKASQDSASLEDNNNNDSTPEGGAHRGGIRPARPSDNTDTSQGNSYGTENDTSSSDSGTASAASSEYKDGVYEGSATGFHQGITTVSVTVKNNTISDIEVVSNGDTPEYFNMAASDVISQILKAQSTNVDAVSGATFSSNGIMNAVENALAGAIN